MNNALAGHATCQTNALSLAQAITERRLRAVGRLIALPGASTHICQLCVSSFGTRAQPTQLCDQVDWSQAGERVRRQDFRSRRLEGYPAGPGVSRGVKPVIWHRPTKPSLVPGHWRRIA